MRARAVPCCSFSSVTHLTGYYHGLRRAIYGVCGPHDFRNTHEVDPSARMASHNCVAGCSSCNSSCAARCLQLDIPDDKAAAWDAAVEEGRLEYKKRM